MSMLKKIFMQSMVISTSILFLNGLNFVLQHFAGNDISLQWYHPITIILTGILCALPTLFLENIEQWDRTKVIRRVILHCLSLYAIVIAASCLFHWYDSIEGYISVSIFFFVIYTFVWFSSLWMDKKDEKKINEALDAVRDTE